MESDSCFLQTEHARHAAHAVEHDRVVGRHVLSRDCLDDLLRDHAAGHAGDVVQLCPSGTGSESRQLPSREIRFA